MNARAKVWKAANRERLRVYDRTYQAGWNARNPQKLTGYRRKSKYGMTADEYRAHVIGQTGRCLICLRVPDHDLHVDHDHITGRVRGLLCRDCNGMLGLSKDQQSRLASAMRYLQRNAA